MEQVQLAIESRNNLGKSQAKKIRRQGKLPAAMYGLGKQATITVDPRKIKALLLEEGGRNKILNLTGGGMDGRHALIKDYQVDPVSRVLMHVDLIEIDVKKKINVTVPVNYTGKAVGVADGGVMNVIERAIEVRCLPTAIPKHIDVDVTALKIGDAIHLDELKLPEGIEKTNLTNPTLVTVVPPAKEEELAPSLAPTAEPEVITEKKAEGEEGAAAAGAEGAKAEAKDAKKEEKKK